MMTKRMAMALPLLLLWGCDGSSSDTDSATDTSIDSSPDTLGDVGDDTTVSDVPGDTAGDAPTDTGTDITWPTVYEVESVSYVNTITIPDVVENVPVCCHDFGDISRDQIEDGTDQLDNAFAVLANALAGLPGAGIDMQLEITTSLENGDLVILLDHRGLDGPTDTFVLAELSGLFDGTTTYAEASTGDGEFLISSESFETGTNVPLYIFDPAQMESRAMSAGPGVFKIMGTFGFLSFPLELQSSLLEGTATIGTDGVSYVNGTVAGYALLTDIFDELNKVALSDVCSCLGITEPVFTQGTSGSWEASCVEDAALLCTTTESAVCATVAGDSLADSQVCNMLPTLIGGTADIDVDGDTDTFEALSFGLEWTGVVATVNGVEP